MNERWVRRVQMVAAVAAAAVIASGCVFLERVSLTSGQVQVSADAVVTDVSADGRYVVFHSDGVFDPDDTNGVSDVFRRDTLTGETVRVSALAATPPNALNGASYDGRISDDGQRIVMVSDATNAVLDDTDGQPDVLMWFGDIVLAGVTVFPLVFEYCGAFCVTSLSNGASIEPDISGDGAFVSWTDTSTDLGPVDTNGVADVYRVQVSHPLFGAPTVNRVSEGPGGSEANGSSGRSAIDADGSAVAFSSDATNLLGAGAGADTNGERDVFRWDGNDVLLVSRHFDTGQTDGPSDRPVISADGLDVAFESDATDVIANDTNGVTDVFLEPNASGTMRVSVAPDLSELTTASALLDADAALERTLWHTAGQAWVHDVTIPSTRLVSTDRNGNPFTASTAALSADGRYVAFSSIDAVMADDTNGTMDVYLRAYNDPQPTGVLPPTVSRGETTTVIIKGTGFAEVSAIFNPFPISVIEWTNVNVVDDNNIIADITVAPTADLGPMFVNLVTPDGGPGVYSGAFGNCECLTVVEPPP